MPDAARDFMRDQCGCKICAKLWMAWRLLTDVKNASQGDISGSATIRRGVRQPKNAILDLLEDLHQEHKPEEYPAQDDCHNPDCRCCYDQWTCPVHGHKQATTDYEQYWEDSTDEEDTDGGPTGEDVEDEQAIEDDQNVPALPSGGRFHGKFMVCDRCRGHALPCNEAPICDQCMMSGTPCVHRLCKSSQNSKEGCSNPECRYVHLDYMPLPHPAFVMKDYLVYPGKLRGYLMDGRVPRLEWSYSGQSSEAQNREKDQATRRQERARIRFSSWLENGEGSLEHLHHACGEYCPSTDCERIAY